MNAERAPARRVRLLAFAALLVTFFVGALAGLAYERVLNAREPVPGTMRDRPAFDRRPMIFAPGGRMAEQLDLTPVQQDRINRILEEDRAKAGAVFEEMEPRLRARYDSTNAAIRAVLTPEQQREFERLQVERRIRMQERFGGRRPGPGGPRRRR